MKLSKLFENEFKGLKMLRVKLKIDPANNNIPYEGYVLHENEDGTLDVVVTSPGVENSVMTIQPNQIDVQQTLSNLDKLKLIIAGTIKDKTIVMQIKDLNTISDIEAMLISNGCTFEDLYEVFKRLFLIHSC